MSFYYAWTEKNKVYLKKKVLEHWGVDCAHAKHRKATGLTGTAVSSWLRAALETVTTLRKTGWSCEWFPRTPEFHPPWSQAGVQTWWCRRGLAWPEVHYLEVADTLSKHHNLKKNGPTCMLIKDKCVTLPCRTDGWLTLRLAGYNTQSLLKKDGWWCKLALPLSLKTKLFFSKCITRFEQYD